MYRYSENIDNVYQHSNILRVYIKLGSFTRGSELSLRNKKLKWYPNSSMGLFHGHQASSLEIWEYDRP